MPASARMSPAAFGVLLAALFVAAPVAPLGAQQCDASIFRAAVADARAHPVASQRKVEQVALEQLYSDPRACPLWSDGGTPTARAMELIGIFEGAGAWGLNPSDYDALTLRSTSSTLAGRGVAAAGEFDVQLTRAAARFFVHLHMGRLDSRALRFNLPHTHDSLNVGAGLLQWRTANILQDAVAQAEPPFAGYWALKRALSMYRAAAADTTLGAWTTVPTLHPRDTSRALSALRQRLTALGDLPASAQPNRDAQGGDVYSDELVNAVMHFQARHGLVVDGVLGRATQAQLRVPIAQRVLQMQLTLERWRWLPDKPPDRFVVVNIPAFLLYAFEHDAIAAHPTLAMSVIVGKAQGRKNTPVFSAVMREVVFRPYWDVPPSIAVNELLPIIRRRPEYLDHEELEIVRGGERGATVYEPTAANLAQVENGTLRLRQRPGDNNSLGLVKFVFPNSYNVYMHGTPAQQLFKETRRDFSHGCIRLEYPTALLDYVLGGQAPWDSTAMQAAMNGTSTVHVPLERPVSVYILYGTVVVGADAVVHFYPDIYGHDATLAKALHLSAAGPVSAGRAAGPDAR